MGQIKNIKLHIVTDIKSVQIQLTAMAGLVRTSLLRNLSAVRTFATSTTHRSLEQAPIKVFGVEGRYAHALLQRRTDFVEVQESSRRSTLLCVPEEERSTARSPVRNPWTLQPSHSSDQLCRSL